MTKSWIFQATPKVFRVDEFMAAKPERCLWRVSCYVTEILPGDRVFLWRARGAGPRAQSGVLGRAAVIEAPLLRRPGSAQEDFWLGDADKTRLETRAMIAIESVAAISRHLSLPSVELDPVLKDMEFLRHREGTNFRLAEDHASRLNALWHNKDKGWSRDDLVVALQVSRLHPTLIQHGPEGKPIAEAALLLGRALSAVATQARMFIEPAMPTALQAVWDEFFDPASGGFSDAKLGTEIVRISAGYRAA